MIALQVQVIVLCFESPYDPLFKLRYIRPLKCPRSIEIFFAMINLKLELSQRDILS